MGCSTPGLPVHHQLLELTQTHVHWVGHAIQPSHPLLSPSPPVFNLSQHQGLFKDLFHRGAEKVWACLTESLTAQRKSPFGETSLLWKKNPQTTKMIAGGESQKSLFQFSALRFLWNFFSSFFIRSDPTNLRWWNLWDQILVPALPCSQPGLTECSMWPLCWSKHVCSPASLKESKVCFATDLATGNSSHHLFWVRRCCLKMPSHCALYWLLLEKARRASVQTCF